MTHKQGWLVAMAVGVIPAAAWFWFALTHRPENPPLFWNVAVGFPFGGWVLALLLGIYHLWRTPEERWRDASHLWIAPAAATALTCALPLLWQWDWAVVALGLVVSFLQCALWDAVFRRAATHQPRRSASA